MSNHVSSMETDTGLENDSSMSVSGEETPMEIEVEGTKRRFTKMEILQIDTEENLALVEVEDNAALPLNSENGANLPDSEEQEVDTAEIPPQTMNNSSESITLPPIDLKSINWSSKEVVKRYNEALLLANPVKNLYQLNDQDQQLPNEVKRRIRKARSDFNRREGLKEKVKNLESEKNTLTAKLDAAHQKVMDLRSENEILRQQSHFKDVQALNERKKLEQRIETLNALLKANKIQF